MFWEYSSFCASEKYPGEMLAFGKYKSFSFDRPIIWKHPPSWAEREIEFYNVWRNTVRRYTACELTKSDDILSALSGLAKQMELGLGRQEQLYMWPLETLLGFRAPLVVTRASFQDQASISRTSMVLGFCQRTSIQP